ncbi:rhomboid family intramembrane serine protease [Pedobacter sp. MC2016-14]|uniref:rhomboid family intramembrane serine protease n=1 Tax=Pedobacter sp. MC2016-14 TaxID=2897327 RepID=UPI001E3B7EA2|nr:rhomboid family intramembrane serine protease [Pedobacter sp. MC2016-14]MCD0487900.1 rhomboid family intramembrane serine protease [Pedobacter sp. MC2016-14]
MNNNIFQELKFKVFKSGNPVAFYIGINVIIYVLTALIGVGIMLGKGSLDLDELIREYFGFPSSFAALPLRFYTLLTFQFFHQGFLHLLFNMLGLFWLGQIFLDFLKPRQFHFVYLFSGASGALVFLLGFNVFPVFAAAAGSATIIGASASVMGIVVATATLLPNYAIRLILFGDVKLKYLALAYVVLDLIGIGSANAGGSFAHLGGALFGFMYIKMLQNGTDWSTIFNTSQWFKKKSKLKVVKNENYRSSVNTRNRSEASDKVNQQVIDSILDKISKSGYDKLSKEEKETLFKASKHS